jgi:hypothetical protein
MKSHVLLLALVSLGACKRRQPDQAPKPPADARVYTAADVGLARYTTVDAIVADNKAAYGQLAVLRVNRSEIRREDFTADPCVHTAHRLFLSIGPNDRDRVRAMPEGPSTDCPRVLVQVMWIDSVTSGGERTSDGQWKTHASPNKIIAAETIAILDVEPRGPKPVPPGVDYATVLDILLGPHDGGAIAELPMKVVRKPRPGSWLNLVACDGGPLVTFPDEKHDGALASLEGCHVIRFRTRKRPSPDWGGRVEADLIDIGS